MKTIKKLSFITAVMFCLGGFFAVQAFAASAEGNMKWSHEKQMTSGHENWVMGKSVRISKVLGKDVKDQNGKTLGEVKDVVLGSEGRATYLIIEHGGTMGMGEKYTAVPWNLAGFAVQKNHEGIVLNVTKEEFGKAPAFSGSKWPNFASSSWKGKVHAYYGTLTDNTMKTPEKMGILPGVTGTMKKESPKTGY